VRVVWKFAGAMPGALYVMTSGMPLMPEWCANSWASPDTVCVIDILCSLVSNWNKHNPKLTSLLFFDEQMLLPFHLPSLDKEVVQLFWMMYDVLGLRTD